MATSVHERQGYGPFFDNKPNRRGPGSGHYEYIIEAIAPGYNGTDGGIDSKSPYEGEKIRRRWSEHPQTERVDYLLRREKRRKRAGYPNTHPRTALSRWTRNTFTGSSPIGK